MNKKGFVYIQWNSIQSLKRRRSHHLDIMDDPGGHYAAQRNIICTEKDKHYLILLIYGILKKKRTVKLREAVSRMVVSKGWGQMGEKWEMLVKG